MLHQLMQLLISIIQISKQMQPKQSANSYEAALQHIANQFGRSHAASEAAHKCTSVDVSAMFQAFAEMPYSADIESLRGWCMQSIHKYEVALYIYNQILVKQPFHAPTLRRKAQLLKKMDQQNQCNFLLNLAALLEPDNLHLQLLREVSSDDSESISDASQQEENQPAEQTEADNKWAIRIKSIDRPLKSIKSVKSVLFKSQLIQDTVSQKNISCLAIKQKKSILKARSFQHTPTTKASDADGAQNKFDTHKIKSIDGKMSTNSEKENNKEVLFSYNDHKNRLTVDSCTPSLRRKSSLVVSKLVTCKSNI